MFRQRSQHIVSVGYTSSQSIEKEENTRRPHIHISDPEVGGCDGVDGDVSQFVDRVGLGALGVVRNQSNTRIENFVP